MNQFFSLPVNSYRAISFGNSYLFRQYDFIQSFITRNFPADFQRLLAMPYENGDEIKWYTSLTGDFLKLEDFTGSGKGEMLEHYNALLYKAKRKCIELENGDDRDGRIWANTLKEVFNYDNNIVFTNGSRIVLVWGWTFFKQDLYRLPADRYQHLLYEDDVSEPEKEQKITETPIEKEEDFVLPVINPPKKEEPIAPVLEKQRADGVEKEKPEEKKKNILKPDTEKVAEAEDKKKFLAYDFFNPAKSKWLYGISLFLLLLLLAYLLYQAKTIFADDMTGDQRKARLVEILPKQPGMRTIPIDTSKFIDDDRSHSKIISDLVNVALIKNSSKFSNLMIDIKQIFPGHDYQIVYYDTQIARLQLHFPVEERDNIKGKLRSKLPAYEILIWDEAVFRTSRSFNDPQFGIGEENWYHKIVNSEKAWDVTIGDTSIKIAILDDGFDLAHIDLSSRITARYNVVIHNSQITSGAENMHGTHVAGIALAQANNQTGIAGIAPGCSFMPVQIGGGQEYFAMSDVIDGILYAVKTGADVINLSLGRQFSDMASAIPPGEIENLIKTEGLDEEAFWVQLFTMVRQKNVFVVVAAGNQDLPIGLDPMQRSTDVLKVAAIGENQKKAQFSNYCNGTAASECFISAPGVNIYSCKPGNTYQFLDGTSMAAPIVTGAVGLIKSVNHKLTNHQIMQILNSTAIPSSDPGLPALIQIDKAVEMARSQVL